MSWRSSDRGSREHRYQMPRPAHAGRPTHSFPTSASYTLASSTLTSSTLASFPSGYSSYHLEPLHLSPCSTFHTFCPARLEHTQSLCSNVPISTTSSLDVNRASPALTDSASWLAARVVVLRLADHDIRLSHYVRCCVVNPAFVAGVLKDTS